MSTHNTTQECARRVRQRETQEARAPAKRRNRAMDTKQRSRGLANAIDRMKRALARLLKANP